MKNSEKEKYYKSYIKSAQSTVALAALLNLVYVIRAVFAKNLDFWFSLYSTQFAIKASQFVPSLAGNISKIACAAIILAGTLVLIIPDSISLKKPQWLWGCFAVYALDTVLMAWGFATNHFDDFSQGSVIDIIFHVFILLFILVGIISNNKLKKLS